MKYLLGILAFCIFACTADYDTFGTSDYRVLNDLSFREQVSAPAVYSSEHRLEFDLQEIPDSLETWDSLTIDDIDVSHFATMHLVESRFSEFPQDSLELDSLADSVAYAEKPLREGEKIRLPAGHVIYMLVVSESKKKSIWKLEFRVPEKVSSSSDEESSSSESVSSSSEKNSGEISSSSFVGKSSASEKSSSSKISENSSSSEATPNSSSAEVLSSSSAEPLDESAPQILSLSIAGKKAEIDLERFAIHVDSLEFRTDLSKLKLSELTLSEGAMANVNVGESYDFGYGVAVTVTGKNGKTTTYQVKAGYQIPGSNFNIWKNSDVVPDTLWNNANTILTTTEKYTSGSMIGAKITTGKVVGKVASGSLYTADFNPKEVATLAMADASKWPDGNELLDFGKPFGARPEMMEVKFSYTGKGDSCEMYILLENRTGNKNINRKASDVNKLIASAWYRSTTADNSGRVNPDVVSISPADKNGMRTLLLKLHYGVPLSGSAIEKTAIFRTTLQSKESVAINNSLVQGTGEEPVTHVRIVFASSADGNHYKGVKDATLIIDSVRLIY